MKQKTIILTWFPLPFNRQEADKIAREHGLPIGLPYTVKHFKWYSHITFYGVE